MSAPMSNVRLFVRGTTLTRVLFQQGMSVSSSPVTHTSNTPTKEGQFDESMLEYLVCPLSKTPLRYDKENNELISDSIGVAYPIKNGIPNLVPTDGRIIKHDKSTKEKENSDNKD